MRRLPNRFRTLHWRFAFSYMLVTALTMFAIPTLYFAASYVFAIRSPDLPRQMAAGLEGGAQLSLPYLVRDPIDRAGLQRWLVDFNTNGRVQSNGNFADLWMSGPPYGTSQMAVVDATGRVVATTSAREMPVGSPVASRLTAPQRRVLAAALAGDEHPADLATPEVSGRAEIAVPITVPGHVVGALVLDMDVAATRSTFLPRAVQGLLGFILLVSVGAGMIGLIFGFVISRGMTRRLRRIARAADAWSRGDFAVEARDPSGDELGQLARDLNRMAEQLQTLLHDRQQLATVEERNRLARDLHDSIKQQVFATSMQVAAARALVRSNPDAAEARLVEVERLMGDAQRELNTLIQELRPPALGDRGLVPALRELAAGWSRATGVAAEVRAQGERPAPLETEQALFRIAQEALSNVARHSGATAVDVRVAWERNGLTLAVQDNGHGFDVAERDGKGVGLRSMRERVEALGGTLLVYGRSDGTRVEASVPLPADAAATDGATPTGGPAVERTSVAADQAKDEALYD